MWKLFNKKAEHKVPEAKLEEEKKAKKPVIDDVGKTETPAKRGTTASTHTRAKHQSTKKGDAAAGFGIMVSPLVSEKTAHIGTFDTYAFVVNQKTNKIEVKKAFKKMYGVNPIRVTSINVAARQKRFGRVTGTQSGFKKVFIRVPKGSVVNVYEGV